MGTNLIFAGAFFGIAVAFIRPLPRLRRLAAVAFMAMAWPLLGILPGFIYQTMFPALVETLILGLVGFPIGFALYKIFESQHKVLIFLPSIFALAAGMSFAITDLMLKLLALMEFPFSKNQGYTIQIVMLQLVLGFMFSQHSPGYDDEDEIDKLVEQFGKKSINE